MKQFDKDDEALRELLKEWRTDFSLPQRFQDQVWQRIERIRVGPPATPSIWEPIVRGIDMAFGRRAIAASYIVFLVMLASVVGWFQANHKVADVQNEMSDRYVQMLDPYQAHHLAQ
jgi:hypothetical protein